MQRRGGRTKFGQLAQEMGLVRAEHILAALPDGVAMVNADLRIIWPRPLDSSQTSHAGPLSGCI